MSDTEFDDNDGQGGTLPTEATSAPALATADPEQAGDRGRRLNKAQRTRDWLNLQPKVSVYIPENEDEMVAINGYTYQLKRGETVEVPRPVAEMLHAKWRATAKSNKPRQVNLGTF